MATDDYQKKLAERRVRQKLLDAIVEKATNAVAASIAETKPSLLSHFYYGSSAIHPRNLVTWYLFKTDEDLKEAQANGLTDRIENLTRDNLQKHDYPAEGVPLMKVRFTTDEDIQRKTGGNYLHYFQ